MDRTIRNNATTFTIERWFGCRRWSRREELSVADLEIDPVHRDKVAKTLPHALEPDGSHGVGRRRDRRK